MNIDEELKRIEKEHEDEYFYEKVIWNIKYFFSDFKMNIKSFFTGLHNFWKFRSDIYHWRWYDYSFLHNVLKARLIDMRDNWKHSHYIGSEDEEIMLIELVSILQKIEDIEDICDCEKYKEIDTLYEEFGKMLFGKTDKIIYYENNGEAVRTIKHGSRFRFLWD
jgi:hypothetical protein